MKTTLILFVIIIFSSDNQSQELGIDLNIGYSKLLMEDVKNHLDNSESVNFDDLIRIPVEYHKLGFGFYSEMGVSARLSQLVLRLSLNYITDDGDWRSVETDRAITQDISVSTLEILTSAGYNIPVFKTASVILEGGLGYGFAASESDFEVRSNLQFYNVLQHEKYSLTGGYFLARLRGGLEANLKFVLLRFVIGYRFANPVVLTGESNVNGVLNDDGPIIKDDGSKLEFDFSGFNYQWGITILL